MEESGQPRWFWEPEHAVMTSVSSNLTILTKFILHLKKGNQILYRLEFMHYLLKTFRVKGKSPACELWLFP